MSYMQVLSYTESGHAISQWYGYLAVFLIGFLWAAMGSHYPTYEKLNKKTYHTRFGSDASWKARPNLKNAAHK